MAVPRPVLIAILGLALCVTALIAVHGVGSEEEAPAPAALPEAPATSSQSSKAERTDSTGSSSKDTGATKADPVSEAGQQAAKPAKPVKPKLSEKQKTLAAVTADLEAGEKVVVLFFTKPGAADDTGARSAVRSLKKVKGVAVYTPNFDDLAEYRPILAGVGVAQIPSIVIAKPGKKAQLVEGFIDAKSLRQQVQDATR